MISFVQPPVGVLDGVGYAVLAVLVLAVLAAPVGRRTLVAVGLFVGATAPFLVVRLLERTGVLG